jgi:hypothetical protein
MIDAAPILWKIANSSPSVITTLIVMKDFTAMSVPALQLVAKAS